MRRGLLDLSSETIRPSGSYLRAKRPMWWWAQYHGVVGHQMGYLVWHFKRLAG